MLNLISNYIPKAFLPLAYLGIGFAVIVLSMFLAGRIGEMMEKRKSRNSTDGADEDPKEINP